MRTESSKIKYNIKINIAHINDKYIYVKLLKDATHFNYLLGVGRHTHNKKS